MPGSADVRAEVRQHIFRGLIGGGIVAQAQLPKGIPLRTHGFNAGAQVLSRDVINGCDDADHRSAIKSPDFGDHGARRVGPEQLGGQRNRMSLENAGG